eukprot:COSAG06_NODE_4648_length_4068_cov_2.547493_3_plen_186_part_00
MQLLRQHARVTTTTSSSSSSSSSVTLGLQVRSALLGPCSAQWCAALILAMMTSSSRDRRNDDIIITNADIINAQWGAASPPPPAPAPVALCLHHTLPCTLYQGEVSLRWRKEERTVLKIGVLRRWIVTLVQCKDGVCHLLTKRLVVVLCCGELSSSALFVPSLSCLVFSCLLSCLVLEKRSFTFT